MFVTVFTRTRHWSLSWARLIHAISPHIIDLGSRSFWWFLSFWLSHQKPMCIALVLHASYMPCPHSLDLIILIILGEDCKLWSSSLCSFLQPPVTLSLFGPNILLSTLFWNTLSLCSSLNVRGQVSYPYKTAAKIIFLHILMFYVFRQHSERQNWMVGSIIRIPYPLNFFMNQIWIQKLTINFI
jgi:hypothetical protein